MKHLKVIALLFILIQANVNAQNLESWWVYPSQKTINDLVSDSDGSIWATTNGGVFTFDGESFDSFSTLQGVSHQGGNAIAYDESSNSVFIGYADGIIDQIEVDNERISVIEDIRRASNYPSKSINDLTVYEGMLYAATNFGIVVIDPNGLFVRDSYIQLGSLNRAASVFTVKIKNDIIYAGTQSGIAFGSITDELTNRDNWQIYDETNGFVSTEILAIGIWEDNLLASTADENYIYDGNTWQMNDIFGSDIIEHYQEISPDEFVAVSPQKIFYSEDVINFDVFSLGSETATSISPKTTNGNIIIGTLNKGVGIFNPMKQEIEYHTPDGPYQNFFSALKVDDGTLISGSTQKSSGMPSIEDGKGYYIYENGEWHNFNKKTNDVLRAANFKLAFTSTITEDYFYFGSWGQGVARHHKETNEIKIFNETNSIIRGWADDDPNYPVISGLATDSNDDVWLVSRFGTRPLYYQKAGAENWINFPKDSIVAGAEFVKLFIDSNDQKWISLQSSTTAGQGLLVIKTGNPENENDDKIVKLTTNPNSGNLPHQQVKAIIEDLNGEVWVGTQRGIARFIFPDLVVEGGPSERSAQWLINADTSATSSYLLRDVNVSTMAINGANEKWIGTENQGIFVVNAEGSKVIKRFTTDNSPLFSNVIKSIAIDDATGEVYIATDMGLISYLDIPQQGREEMEKLKVFPNPFNYNQHSQIVIEGLSEESTIKIVGVDGTMVQELSVRGGRTSWNALDYSGQKLGSGVYFVVAYEEGGKNRGMGKVVIIN